MKISKKSIVFVAVCAVLMSAVLAISYEREQLSVNELTVNTIKNPSGSTVGVSTTGSSFTATGTVQGRKGKFVNISTSGTHYGNVAGTVTGHSSLDVALTGSTMTGPVKQRSGAAAVFPNISGTRYYGAVTGNVTGTSSLDLPLAGGTMTGAIKAKVPGNAFTSISTTSVTIGGHTFSTYTATIEGSVKHLLGY